MNAHKTQATIAPDGKLELSGLPFGAGATVEVIVLERESPSPPTFPPRGAPDESLAPKDAEAAFDAMQATNPLRGSVLKYDDPFGPACDPDDWEGLRDSP